jgi:hypothetical protein
MIDFTTIQANPIPLPIIELQTANTALQGENKILRNVLIIVGVIGAIYIVDKAITYKKEENARKNKGKLPNIKENDSV